MILQRVTPVTHSVGNCLKRVIVIVASVIVFQNPMSKQNMIGKLQNFVCCEGLFSNLNAKNYVWQRSVRSLSYEHIVFNPEAADNY